MKDEDRLFLLEIEVILAITSIAACIGVIVRTMQGLLFTAIVVLIYAIILAVLVCGLDRWRTRQ